MTLFGGYRALAYVVGVLLAFGTFVALPTKYLLTEGSSGQEFGESASLVWVVHGWVFMIYVVVAFVLSRRQGWSTRFTAAGAGGRPGAAAHLLGGAPGERALPRRARGATT